MRGRETASRHPHKVEKGLKWFNSPLRNHSLQMPVNDYILFKKPKNHFNFCCRYFSPIRTKAVRGLHKPETLGQYQHWRPLTLNA